MSNMTRESQSPQQSTHARTPIYIDILRDGDASPVGCSPADLLYSHGYHAPTKAHSSNAPQSIRTIDPTLKFLAPSIIDATSSFIVLFDGAPIHSEDTRLTPVAPAPSVHPQCGTQMFYSTPLVPNFWEVIRNSQDPTLYSILQDVRRIDENAPRELPRRQRFIPIFSAVYHFRYVAPLDATAAGGHTSGGNHAGLGLPPGFPETPTQLPTPLYNDDFGTADALSAFEDGLTYMNLISDFTADSAYDLAHGYPYGGHVNHENLQ